MTLEGYDEDLDGGGKAVKTRTQALAHDLQELYEAVNRLEGESVKRHNRLHPSYKYS